MSGIDSLPAQDLAAHIGCCPMSCSGSSDLTENAAKQNLQENSPLQDKGLLRVIFANEAKTRQKPIYQKTEML
jgi:hypothetical protein